MSWDNWAKMGLLQKNIKAADHVGFYGNDGRCWGASDDFAREVPTEFVLEAAKIMSAGIGAGKLSYKDKGYISIYSDESVVKAKKGTAGVSVCKTKQGYIVSFYDGEDVSGQNNFTAASQVSDQLKELGY